MGKITEEFPSKCQVVFPAGGIRLSLEENQTNYNLIISCFQLIVSENEEARKTVRGEGVGGRFLLDLNTDHCLLSYSFTSMHDWYLTTMHDSSLGTMLQL
jgi:hypothetical protein